MSASALAALPPETTMHQCFAKSYVTTTRAFVVLRRYDDDVNGRNSVLCIQYILPDDFNYALGDRCNMTPLAIGVRGIWGFWNFGKIINQRASENLR